MKVIVDIDAIGLKLDSLVEQRLAEEGLPICFGNMVPPILVRTLSMEDTEVLKPKGSIPADQVAVEVVNDIVVGAESKEKIRKTDLVLTKVAAEEINEYKKDRAERYVKQLVGCSNCNLVDVCDRLTKNYLKFIEVEGQYKKGGRLR
jgi:hypothetical protein